MKIYKSILDLIGSTPLLELSNFCAYKEIESPILAKLEFFNPAGSVKDRVAANMIITAEEKGIIKKGATIIEPTSGNTGIGLAAVGISKGYKVILTMPDTMSVERRNLLKAYGAEIVLTDGANGMAGAIKKAKELADKTPNSFIPSQFENPSNPEAHIKTTGPEIWNDTEGKLEVFVACIGTGGTISGIGKYLKSKNPEIKVIGIEPKSSPLLTEGKSGPHKIQGIGANFIPNTLDLCVVDEIITVSDTDALNTGNMIAKKEGILVGISSGAALFGACEIAKREEYINKKIVVLFPDTGERYLSTDMYK